MGRALEPTIAVATGEVLDVDAAYRDHADHVWRSLHRLGVPPDDAADLLQEVFAVVHRRRREWDGRPLRAWLFGICVGLVRNHRRRAFRWRERLTDAAIEIGSAASPHEAAEARERRARGRQILAELDPEKRAVFVMFEVEGMSGRAIAELLDVPLGTVHSRLHAARRELARALAQREEEVS